MKIYIQHMVSLRCKMMVGTQLDKLGIGYRSIELGEVQLAEPLSDVKRPILKQALSESGLILIQEKNAVLIEQIINLVVEMVHYSDELPNVNFSQLLSEKMNQDYKKMAAIFSKIKGVTIEHFIILHKVERIKELIIYDELNLTEISYKLNYSSVAHLSKQFKQVTGLTPSFFKSLSQRNRINLEDL
jgi:AraC-like DNA-binding protein